MYFLTEPQSGFNEVRLFDGRFLFKFESIIYDALSFMSLCLSPAIYF